MSAPTQHHRRNTSSGFACKVTATDGWQHLVHDSDWTAAHVFGVELRTLCVLTIEQAPLTAAGEPCPWCRAVADHAELADPMNLGSGRVARFVDSLKAGAGAR